MSGYSRSYKMKVSDFEGDVQTTKTYSMIQPLAGELTPTGYQIVFQDEFAVSDASESVWVAEVQKFLTALGVKTTNLTTYTDKAKKLKRLCGNDTGVYLNDFHISRGNTKDTGIISLYLTVPAPYDNFTVYCEYQRPDRIKESINFVFRVGETQIFKEIEYTRYDSPAKVSLRVLPHDTYFIDETKQSGGYKEAVITEDDTLPQIWVNHNKTPIVEHKDTLTYVTWFIKSNKALKSPTEIFFNTCQTENLSYNGARFDYKNPYSNSAYNTNGGYGNINHHITTHGFMPDRPSYINDYKFTDAPKYLGEYLLEGYVTTVHPRVTSEIRLCFQVKDVDDYITAGYVPVQDTSVDNEYYKWRRESKGLSHILSNFAWYEDYEAKGRTILQYRYLFFNIKP
jgi:hypothetical protein